MTTESENPSPAPPTLTLGDLAFDLANRFTYHPPKPGQTEKYQELRELGKVLAERVVKNCPNGRERAIALTKIEEAIFWANAAIARNG